jgi:hypothetical protein
MPGLLELGKQSDQQPVSLFAAQEGKQEIESLVQELGRGGPARGLDVPKTVLGGSHCEVLEGDGGLRPWHLG